MAKSFSRYVCQQCGRVSASYMGKCPQCNSFNSMVEEMVNEEPAAKSSVAKSGLGTRSRPQKIGDVTSSAEQRIAVPIGEFSRVLGGGIVPGSLVLIGGDPGIGKSTLMLQVTMEISKGTKTLYITGEESEQQIKMRADRLVIKGEKLPENLFLVNETSLPIIFSHIKEIQPDVVIVDSIQTVFDSDYESSAGSVTQVRECSAQLRELAKGQNISIFLIGHVTKEGVIAGPRVLEHIVDTVLYLEGDRYQSFRLLRSVKNRFGPTSEVGVFEMNGSGLKEVTNPSEAFLSERLFNAPGSSIAVTVEGTRPLLVEVQGLTSPAQFGNARRTPNGVDHNRLLMLAAVITRRLGLKLVEQDIFVNVVGGIRIDEPAADLAIAIAITSSYKDIPLEADTVFIGEIGLAGELRMPPQIVIRVKEAQKLGFKKAVIPHSSKKSEGMPKGIEIIEVRSLSQAIDYALQTKRA
jgi:DNA repair protein RadA/Sms